MPLNSYTKISDFFSDIYTIKVEQHHIDFLDNEYQNFCKSRTHADSLIFEYDLEYNGFGDKAIHKAHDIRFGNILPDFKEIHKTYHNIETTKKLKWMRKCVIDGLVTHYIPFKVINRNRHEEFMQNIIYKLGDYLQIQVMGIYEARSYLKTANKSIREPDGWYILP